MNGPDEWDGRELPGSPGERPRIPSPRPAAEDHGPLPDAPPAPVHETVDDTAGGPRAPEAEPVTEPPAPLPLPLPAPAPPHRVLKSLLGAWALAACSAEETAAVEAHLTDCASCADEALRLRDAVGLLHPADSLDLDPLLRSRVLEGCLGRRPAAYPGARVGDAVRRGDRQTGRPAA